MANAAAAPARKLGRNAFLFIIVTVCIDMMAFAVIMPSMPELIAPIHLSRLRVARGRQRQDPR
jgi:hypothetical protein